MNAVTDPALSVDRVADFLESLMIDGEQIECPVTHYFGPGVYFREMSAPAGALIVGHRHRFECVNELLRGKVALLKDGGAVDVVEAPFRFVSAPGRKIGFVIEDMVWRNVHATDETDLDRLESLLIEKSPLFLAHEQARQLCGGG